MSPSITFRLLPGPIPYKTLMAFRKDAGWDNKDDAADGNNHPDGRVQWVTMETGSRVIGIARLEIAPPQFCFVSDFIVLSGQRRRGRGQWFMQQIEQHCRQIGIPRVLLQPTDASQGFYEKLAFVSDPRVAGFLRKDVGLLQRRI
jgi:GNAT superfamily N-acetyltransferase